VKDLAEALMKKIMNQVKREISANDNAQFIILITHDYRAAFQW
jgi:hypothetical protein